MPGPTGTRFTVTLHPEDVEIDERVVHGEQLKALTPEQCDKLIKNNKTLVFARTTPEQKLLIVEECQKRKEVVAVTGETNQQQYH
jgi:sodium/potassium-transporting ATPase subunit alpha